MGDLVKAVGAGGRIGDVVVSTGVRVRTVGDSVGTGTVVSNAGDTLGATGDVSDGDLVGIIGEPDVATMKSMMSQFHKNIVSTRNSFNTKLTNELAYWWLKLYSRQMQGNHHNSNQLR